MLWFLRENKAHKSSGNSVHIYMSKEVFLWWDIIMSVSEHRGNDFGGWKLIFADLKNSDHT